MYTSTAARSSQPVKVWRPKSDGMNARTLVAGSSGNASVAPAQVKPRRSLLRPSRPDDGRAQATRSSGNDLPAPMGVDAALRDSGDTSLPMPSLSALKSFLREYYLHSRFEGRDGQAWGDDYSDAVTRSTAEHLLATGISCVDMYDSNRGRVVWFDRALRVLNPDEPPAQIQARAGNLTHIYGQALS